ALLTPPGRHRRGPARRARRPRPGHRPGQRVDGPVGDLTVRRRGRGTHRDAASDPQRVDETVRSRTIRLSRRWLLMTRERCAPACLVACLSCCLLVWLLALAQTVWLVASIQRSRLAWAAPESSASLARAMPAAMRSFSGGSSPLATPRPSRAASVAPALSSTA